MAEKATKKAKAQNVLEWIWYAYNNGFGYIWGTCWILWTEAKQKAATREMTVKYGAKWIGHTVCDCANLLRGAFIKCGVTTFHAGSNLIFDCDLKDYGKLQGGKRTDGKGLLPCTAVFTGDTVEDHPHVGMYVGNGDVIEAAGTREGVIKSKISDKKWKWWGEIIAVDYSDVKRETAPGPDPEPTPEKYPTIRRGDKGEYVKLAQTLLKQRGYDLGTAGVDGDFGRATENAVKKFQRDWGLDVDGVIGQKTWQMLKTTPVKDKTYAVTIRGLDLTQANALMNSYPGYSSMKEE